MNALHDHSTAAAADRGGCQAAGQEVLLSEPEVGQEEEVGGGLGAAAERRESGAASC